MKLDRQGLSTGISNMKGSSHAMQDIFAIVTAGHVFMCRIVFSFAEGAPAWAEFVI
jgi:hypothetical protein